MKRTDEELREITKAFVDFECLNDECGKTVQFSLFDASGKDFQAVCSQCHKAYSFDDSLRKKLRVFLELIFAIRNAEDILGDCNVAVTVPAGSVKIPYALLLTRLNTIITLKLGDRNVDFHFRVEPSSPQTFR